MPRPLRKEGHPGLTFNGVSHGCPHNSNGLDEADPEHRRGRIRARIVMERAAAKTLSQSFVEKLIRPIERVQNRRMRYAHNLCDVLQSTLSPQRWFHVGTTSTLRRHRKPRLKHHSYSARTCRRISYRSNVVRPQLLHSLRLAVFHLFSAVW